MNKERKQKNPILSNPEKTLNHAKDSNTMKEKQLSQHVNHEFTKINF